MIDSTADRSLRTFHLMLTQYVRYDYEKPIKKYPSCTCYCWSHYWL
ncbi:hypothetical protein VCR29J2_430294 [Vibrio coralliirubri]|nr:hypothetical protein VCR29J2_430294 [Vibrio coralliirubri]